MIVELREPNPDHPELSVGHPYHVIGIEADDLRLLNDHGQPVLYPADLFHVRDATEPADWITETGDDGERYAYPPALHAPGFFEDLFNGHPDAIQTFWNTINRTLTAA